MNLRTLFVSFVLALTGCSGMSFSGKIVSCADQKPIDGATLKYTGSGPAGANMMGEMPTLSKADGTYSANVSAADGTVVTLNVKKDGYTTKDQQLTPGADQTICLDPATK